MPAATRAQQLERLLFDERYAEVETQIQGEAEGCLHQLLHPTRAAEARVDLVLELFCRGIESTNREHGRIWHRTATPAVQPVAPVEDLVETARGVRDVKRRVEAA